jgi:lysophospholipase L1-like esterase
LGNARNVIKIVAMGDSTTAGTPGFLSPLESPPNGAGDKESQYSYWLMQKHPDWNVLNRGINGERSDQILARFRRNVIEEEPEIAVILAGVNDIYQGLPSEYAARNLSMMYSMATQADIIPVSCTVLPYNTMGAKEAEVRRKLNAWIESESRGSESRSPILPKQPQIRGIGICSQAPPTAITPTRLVTEKWPTPLQER